MTLDEQYNCTRSDLYRAECVLRKSYSDKQALEVERLKLKVNRLYHEIKASGPSVRDIQADDGVLL